MDDGERIRRLIAERDELLERIRQLEENWTTPLLAPGAFGLTLTEGRIVSALMRADFLPHERMRTLFPNTTPETLKVHVSKIRKKLAPHGATIGTVYGEGYMIAPGHKDILRAAQPTPTICGRQEMGARASA